MGKFILIIIVNAFSWHSFAAENTSAKENEITWIHWDDPPLFILSGPFQGQGILDGAEKELRKQLTQYKHRSVEATVLRATKEAELKTHTCVAGLLDTEEWRRAFYFSKPIFVTPTNGLLIKQSHHEEIADLAPYSLQKILDKKTEWKLGTGRLYGDGIDNVLNNHRKNPQITSIPSSYRVHQMLAKDRIQFTLGYPYEASYYNRLFNSKDPVVYEPLSENPKFGIVYAACSRSDWGRKVIQDVNKVLETPGVLVNMSVGGRLWFPQREESILKKTREEIYKKNYPKLFGKPLN